LLFDLWFGVPHRPTRDADFLGFGPADTGTLRDAIRKVRSNKVADGMVFDPDSLVIEEIREAARYRGLRAKLVGRLGNARCPIQLDVGFGDAVTPGAEDAEYPTLLDGLPAPRLRVYPRATVVAEKLEAVVSLGMANSRMKDYFDLFALVTEGVLEAQLVGQAIASTFARRGTALPDGLPLGLSDEFANDAAKIAQWRAFIGKNRLEAPTLDVVIKEVRNFLAEPLRLARKGVATP
jgi:Nucleotidyl transferase AbiEii toxin, Type IV TA system